MAQLESFIARLRKEMTESAISGLRTPKTRDAFELGRLHGYQVGLAKAEELLNDILRESDERTAKPGRK